jgi:hypothetical protein
MDHPRGIISASKMALNRTCSYQKRWMIKKHGEAFNFSTEHPMSVLEIVNEVLDVDG